MIMHLTCGVKVSMINYSRRTQNRRRRGALMGEFLADFTSAERLYVICALVGGVLFFVRTLMNLISGFGHDAGFDMDADHGDFSMDHSPDVSGEADTSFRALSIQGITAFFMMFGLVGLAMSRQSQLSATFSSLGGVLAGIITVWVIGRIFVNMQKLQSDGTLRYENAIGQEGSVYLTIPKVGYGQVNVPIQQHMRLCQAVAVDKSEIKTGERIIVVDVVDGNVLVVSKAG